MIGAGSVTTVGRVRVGAVGSTGWLFFWISIFFGRVAHSVRFRPALGLLAILGLDEAVVGVATGLIMREVVLSKLKIRSPSSSNSCAVLTSQAGYLRDRLTFVGISKLAS